jgi:hypothetical protein
MDKEDTKFGLSMYFVGMTTGVIIGSLIVFFILKDNLVF